MPSYGLRGAYPRVHMLLNLAQDAFVGASRGLLEAPRASKPGPTCSRTGSQGFIRASHELIKVPQASKLGPRSLKTALQAFCRALREPFLSLSCPPCLPPTSVQGTVKPYVTCGLSTKILLKSIKIRLKSIKILFKSY